MKKKMIVIKIIENIILAILKSYIIIASMLAAYIDDYIVPPTTFQKILILGIGIGISIFLDIIINYFIYKILRNKEDEKFKSLLYVSFIVTLIIWIVLYFTA